MKDLGHEDPPIEGGYTGVTTLHGWDVKSKYDNQMGIVAKHTVTGCQVQYWKRDSANYPAHLWVRFGGVETLIPLSVLKTVLESVPYDGHYLLSVDEHQNMIDNACATGRAGRHCGVTGQPGIRGEPGLTKEETQEIAGQVRDTYATVVKQAEETCKQLDEASARRHTIHVWAPTR